MLLDVDGELTFKLQYVAYTCLEESHDESREESHDKSRDESHDESRNESRATS